MTEEYGLRESVANVPIGSPNSVTSAGCEQKIRGSGQSSMCFAITIYTIENQLHFIAQIGY